MSVPKIAEKTPHLVEWMVSPEAEEYEFAYTPTPSQGGKKVLRLAAFRIRLSP